MKIIVGMSGGVDSTIAAYILKKEGHEVVGVNFNFVNENIDVSQQKTVGASTESPLSEIAKKLNIKVINRDYHSEFREKIIASFVHDYENGITPNPCALCNATMKFAKLLEVMKEEGADMVATGHYANVCTYGNGECCESVYCIQKSANQQKDQSYMLYRLTQEELSHIIFPLGNMDKSEVRKLAEDLGLPNAAAKDSQDVCFIQNEINYKEFIKQFELGRDYKDKIAKGELSPNAIDELPFFRKGEFVDTKGNVLGFHNGIINYTIGQRRGINIAFGDRRFVVKIDVEKNQVVLGTNEDLLSDEFKIYDLVFSGYRKVDYDNKKCEAIAKLRYRHEGTICDVDFSTLKCKLHEPVRAITPGQAAVFYDNEGRILFGGRIAL